MTDEEQRKFLSFVVRQLRACHRELTVYRAVMQVVKDAGVQDVDEVLNEARNSEEIRKATEAYFAGFDELIEQASGVDRDQALLKLLEQYKPDGEPN
jgi:hemoglobin-like flavoprotein